SADTRAPEPNWADDECGRETPAAAHAAIVRPEQSYALGPTPPCVYALPTWARANFTAAAARPETGTSTTGVCLWVSRETASREGASRSRSLAWRRPRRVLASSNF